jgi:hypothetical protein
VRGDPSSLTPMGEVIAGSPFVVMNLMFTGSYRLELRTSSCDCPGRHTSSCSVELLGSDVDNPGETSIGIGLSTSSGSPSACLFLGSLGHLRNETDAFRAGDQEMVFGIPPKSSK